MRPFDISAHYIDSISPQSKLDSKQSADNTHAPHINTLTTFIQGDLKDKNVLKSIFTNYHINAVLHFAAFAYVGESVKEPQKYYRNNVANTLNLLEVMKAYDCKKLIFSSTCATYGDVKDIPIQESHPQNPINPYGYSKLVIEQMCKDFAKAYGFEYVILRYFNAAGASCFFDIGESHSPETHVIPLLLQTALKQRAIFTIYGSDYPTRDGSCVRDYIHIDDLCVAHILALRHLYENKGSDVFNLGSSSGFSVFELLKSAQNICGSHIPHVIESRRLGDPAILIGDSTKARQTLGWNPQFCDVDTILRSAFRWHSLPRY